MKRIGMATLILAGIFVCTTTVHAGDTKDKEQVFAVQERIFHRNHEIGFLIGNIVDDDFYNVYPLGLSYTYHFNDHLAWEVVRGQYMLNREKDLKKDLENKFGVTPSEFSEPRYLFHSSLVIKPFYGKESLWNRGIVNRESAFFVGAGIVNYEKQYSFGDPTTENAPSICLGYAAKFFLSKNICMNFEIRDLINMKDDGTENDVYLGLALSLRFNLSPRKSPEDETISKLQYYLKEHESDE